MKDIKRNGSKEWCSVLLIITSAILIVFSSFTLIWFISSINHPVPLSKLLAQLPLSVCLAYFCGFISVLLIYLVCLLTPTKETKLISSAINPSKRSKNEKHY